jgi:hypothetical protein
VRGAHADPGIVSSNWTSSAKGDCDLDATGDLVDIGFELLDVGEHPVEQKRVVVAKASHERFPSRSSNA